MEGSRRLNPYAPPFYPSGFHHFRRPHHANPPPPPPQPGKKKFVRCSVPVPTGPRIRLLQGFNRRKRLPPVNGGDHRLFRKIFPLNEHSTSVMIRNIPNNYTRSLLIEFLDSHCKLENEKAGNTTRSAFDFVYLPVDFRHRLNTGYAFVNFTTSEAALKFHAYVKGKKWDLFQSKKIADVSRARIQGKESLVKHFEKMKLHSPSTQYLPVWFEPPRDGCMTDSKMHTIGEA